MTRRELLLAGLCALLVALLFIRGSNPAEAALREQAEQLRDSVEAAKARADAADAALQAEVDASVQAAEEARREVARATRVAAQTAAAAEARLRTVLDSVGLSAAPVDSLVTSWQVQVEVRDVRIENIPEKFLKKFHFLVASFLQRYNGQGIGAALGGPAPAVTTKDRLGLVTVVLDGETYVIVDILMRMLTPRELFRCQGFPDDYAINTRFFDEKRGKWRTLTKGEQVRMVGNSVPPQLAAAIFAANRPDLIVSDEAARRWVA